VQDEHHAPAPERPSRDGVALEHAFIVATPSEWTQLKASALGA